MFSFYTLRASEKKNWNPLWFDQYLRSSKHVHLSYCRSFHIPALLQFVFEFLVCCRSLTFQIIISDTPGFLLMPENVSSQDGKYSKFSQSTILRRQRIFNHLSSHRSKLYLFSALYSFLNHLIKHPIFILMLASTTLPGVNFQLMIGFVRLCSIPH